MGGGCRGHLTRGLACHLVASMPPLLPATACSRVLAGAGPHAPLAAGLVMGPYSELGRWQLAVQLPRVPTLAPRQGPWGSAVVRALVSYRTGVFCNPGNEYACGGAYAGAPSMGAGSPYTQGTGMSCSLQ